MKHKYKVVIAGGGPVGLFLGYCLQRKGISCLILEKRKNPIAHSRSIGIHPVSLELFAQVNLAQDFVARGIKIRRGIAFSDHRQLGTISFASCPPPYNYILSLPQHLTEHILETRLTRTYPHALNRGAEVLSLNEGNDSVIIDFSSEGNSHRVKADFLVGCDGKNSLVRQKAGIQFQGKSYPDTYIMGDFKNNTGYGTDAAIFLTSSGLVESFPLIDNKRRWVIKTDEYISDVSRYDLEQHLAQRTGHNISCEPHTMLSSFGVQRLIAEAFVRGRILLAGDAAHVVSPIGGQGMNLGWIDAWHLTQTFEQIYSRPDSNWQFCLSRYSQVQRKIARQVARRAELNTRLGRKTPFYLLRNAAVWLMLNTPIDKLMAQVFTMRRLTK